MLVGTTSINAAPLGFMKGVPKDYFPQKLFEVAEGNMPAVIHKTQIGPYAEYALIIRSGNGRKKSRELPRIKNANHRLELPAPAVPISGSA